MIDVLLQTMISLQQLQNVLLKTFKLNSGSNKLIKNLIKIVWHITLEITTTESPIAFHYVKTTKITGEGVSSATKLQRPQTYTKYLCSQKLN